MVCGVVLCFDFIIYVSVNFDCPWASWIVDQNSMGHGSSHVRAIAIASHSNC